MANLSEDIGIYTISPNDIHTISWENINLPAGSLQQATDGEFKQ
jgi:hypothetical protein